MKKLRLSVGVLKMRIARTISTVICMGGVAVSSLLLAICLSASGLPLIAEVAALAALLAVVLLTIILVTAQLICRRDASKKETTACFERRIITDFIKATAVGLALGSAMYVLWLIFASDRISIRFMFLMASFVFPVATFQNAVWSLLKKQKGIGGIGVSVQILTY